MKIFFQKFQYFSIKILNNYNTAFNKLTKTAKSAAEKLADGVLENIYIGTSLKMLPTWMNVIITR